MNKTHVLIGVMLLSALALMVSGSWIHVKAELAQLLLHKAWSQTELDGEVHKPWSWADHWPVASLHVPQHDIKQIVLAGDSGNVLAFAPGHNSQSALPGQPGTVVISGHRDTHFRFLQYLQPGQRVNIQTATNQAQYRITGSQVVDVNNTRINLQEGVDRLLMVTCYPFDSLVAGGPLRYVVMAEPVSI